MIVGAGLDGSGRPSCCALGPGNTVDVTTLIPVVGGRGDEHRSVVCLNADEASKEAADREAIVAALREQLRGGDKSLVGNKGSRRYLSGSDSPGFRIDETKIAADARSDGKWVLRPPRPSAAQAQEAMASR